MNSLQYQTSWSATNNHWIPNTPDDPNAINAPVVITPAKNQQHYDPRPTIQTNLLQSADTSLDRPHSPASYTMSASPTASSYMQCPSPEREKFKLNVNHQDENGNTDARVMYYWPDEDTFASFVTRIQRKLNEYSINRLKYLNSDGIEIVVGDDEDLHIALYSHGDKSAAHSFWTMRRNESLMRNTSICESQSCAPCQPQRGWSCAEQILLARNCAEIGNLPPFDTALKPHVCPDITL